MPTHTHTPPPPTHTTPTDTHTTPTPTETHTAATELGNFLLGTTFPCLAGRSAWRQNTITHHHYHQLGNKTDAQKMTHDLTTYINNTTFHAKPFTSFIATFTHPHHPTETEFEHLMWQHLQHIHNHDHQTHPWAPGYSNNPQSPHFAYSVATHPFFVIGLHPTHNRPGRRPTHPTLAFNSHTHFHHIKQAQLWNRLQQKTRQQDLTLHGTTNPNLTETHTHPETRRYSGTQKPPHWQCPLTTHPPQIEPDEEMLAPDHGYDAATICQSGRDFLKETVG